MLSDLMDCKSKRGRLLALLLHLLAVLAFAGAADNAVLAQQDRWAAPRAVMVRTIQGMGGRIVEETVE